MEAINKTTLGLNLPTDPRWVDVASMNIRDILVDHAYCEQKAASSCISLIVKFPEKTDVVDVLTPVVAEEWAHFERVLEQLKKRGWELGKMRKDEYVVEINKIPRKGGSRDEQLVEKLLLNALIEARSCERFKILWKNIEDDELSKFYYELMVSEAGHYHNFIELAKKYGEPAQIDKRWNEILKSEAHILSKMDVRSDRMH